LPAGRISSIIGAEVKVSSGSDDLANEAYWSMIRGHKDYWEILLNTQIFSKFGKVKLQFPKAHKVDEVRLADSRIKYVDYFEKLQTIGVDYNMLYVQDLLQIKDEYLNSKKLKPMMRDPNSRQGFSKISDLEKDTAKQGLSRDKRKQQQTSTADKQKLGM